MNLFCMTTRDHILPVLLLRKQMYQHAEADLVIFSQDDRFKDIASRMLALQLWRNVYIVSNNKLPASLTLSWYREYVHPLASSRKDRELVELLKKVNPYMSIALYEDTLEVYTNLSELPAKIFAYSPQMCSVPVSAYRLPADVDRNVLGTLDYILGFNAGMDLLPESVVLTGTYRTRIDTQLEAYLSKIDKPHVFLADGVKYHPFVGENLSVYSPKFPAYLMYKHWRALCNPTIYVYNALDVPNLEPLAKMDIDILVYTSWMSEESQTLVRRLLGCYKRVKLF